MATAIPERTDCLTCNSPGCKTRTIFVHLQDGREDTLTGVTGIELTDTDVLLHLGSLTTVSYPRSNVYYACCDEDMSPPQC